MTKNLHLEHPEDAILLGEENVIKWLQAPASTSVKMDGSVAIVWGINPENNRFFVGKKSVFNKVKVQICYTADDIQRFYSDKVELAAILTDCLECLPRIEGVFQGDYIGSGGQLAYTPNTITYVMPSMVSQKVVIAPHTEYKGKTISECVATPLERIMEDTEFVKFVQPAVDIARPLDIDQWEDNVLATQELFDCCAINNLFLTQSEYAEAVKSINAEIRSGETPSYEFLLKQLKTEELTRLYFFTLILKNGLMENAITYSDCPVSFIGDVQIDYEGLVRWSKFGTYKLVHRLLFSAANFNNTRFRSAEG